tara:strand:- start:1044 stop:1229 length:186 start_codon:yes stop_codon:yes gene_type:complete
MVRKRKISKINLLCNVIEKLARKLVDKMTEKKVEGNISKVFIETISLGTVVRVDHLSISTY